MARKKKYHLREVHSVCIYARYSAGSRQTDQSIEGQLQVCRDYAAAQGYTVTRIYRDSHISGTTDDRAQFRQMLADSDTGAFDAVLVWKNDRFGRNLEEQVVNEMRLKNNGVSLISVTEPLADGPLGPMQKALLMGIAEFYSAANSENVRRGMRQAALNCQVISGAIPFGYRKGADKRFALDPPAADMVREIYQRYDCGEKIFSIMDDCNRRGFRTVQRSAPFTHNTMYSILSNERYTGVYLWKDVRIEGGMPQIVDRELFERVRAKMQQNKKAPARSKSAEPFLLTTRCFCALCGAPMIGDSGTGKNGTTHYYYSCAARKNARSKRDACPQKSIRKDALEELVLRRTLSDLLQPQTCAQIARQLVEYQQKDRTGVQLEALARRRRQVQKAIENLLDLAEAGQCSAGLADRLALREKELEEIDTAAAQLRAERSVFTEKEILRYLQSFSETQLHDAAFRQRLAETFLQAVYVAPDTVVICYPYTAPQTPVTLDTVRRLLDDNAAAPMQPT